MTPEPSAPTDPIPTITADGTPRPEPSAPIDPVAPVNADGTR